jgi:hypothetical protein
MGSIQLRLEMGCKEVIRYLVQKLLKSCLCGGNLKVLVGWG